MGIIPPVQDLGIFAPFYPSIEKAMARTDEVDRKAIEKYTILNDEMDPQFPFQGAFKVNFFCVTKLADEAHWTVFVASRSDPLSEGAQREREARRLLSDHPDVLLPVAVATGLREEYLITELCNQGSLRSVYKHNHITDKSRNWIAWKVACVVRRCHKRALVHQDLKPENILMQYNKRTDHFTIKLTDFGLASVHISRGGPAQASLKGTARYIAPEQWAEAAKNGGMTRPKMSADGWALGCVLFFIQTGRKFSRAAVLSNKKIPVNMKWNSPFESRLGNLHGPIRDLLVIDPKNRASVYEVRDRLQDIFIATYIPEKAIRTPQTELADLNEKAQQLVKKCVTFPAQCRRKLFNRILSFIPTTIAARIAT